MVTIKVTRQGNTVFIDRQAFPITEELRKIFGNKEVLYFEATINNGTATLARTVPAP